MFRFILQISASVCILLFWMILNDIVLQPNAIKKTLEGSESVKHVILGDSHAERIWISDAINLAVGGAPLHTQALLLKVCSSRFTHLQSVIVSVGPHNFSNLAEDRILNNADNYLSGNASRLAMINDVFDQTPSNHYKIRQLVGELLFPQAFPVQLSEPPQVKTSDLNIERTLHRLKSDQVLSKNWFNATGTSAQAIWHLSDWSVTRDFCPIWFVGTPLHRSYLDSVEADGYQKYTDFLRQVSREEHLHYVSLEAASLPDSFYLDADHLNVRGIHWIADTLERVICSSRQ